MDENIFASFPRRLAAGAIDCLPKLAICLATYGLLKDLNGTYSLILGIVIMVAAVFVVVNEIVLLAALGRTVGCYAAGIVVVNSDRKRERGIGVAAAIVRALAMSAVSWIFLLGYVWYFVDAKKRMWHDLLAATMVSRVGQPIPEPSVEKSVGRVILALVVCFFGFVAKLPIAVIVLSQLFYFSYAPFMARAPTFVRVVGLPADFPSAVVVPEADRVSEIATADLGAGLKETIVTWKDMPGEPTSVLIAFKVGFDLLGMKTEVKYTDNGPRITFSKGDAGISGVVAAVPTADEKRTKSLTLDVVYPSAATSTAVTSTAR